MAKARRPVSERFWEKVNRNGPTPEHCPELGSCWLWTANTPAGRYGLFCVERGKAAGAHRVAYELERGSVPPGYYVLHRCDNPRCVRPDHLFVGTAKDNAADMVAKRRHTLGRKRPGTGPGGTRNRNARLTEEQVAAIRLARTREGLSARAIAQRFGIGKSQAHNIITGAQWKDVPWPQ